MSRLVPIAVSWVLALILGLFQVLDWPHLVLLAGCATALVLVFSHTDTASPHLPDLPLHSRPGARRDLSALSWSAIEREGYVSPAVVARVRVIAAADPGLEPLHRTIAASPRPSPSQVLRWLDTIEAARTSHPDQGDR